jgi:signal transduction histidine kinase
MISINKWFSKNAKYPLFVLGVTTLVVQICFIIYFLMVQSKSQQESIENLFTIANLALEQKNRPVLESTIDLAVEDRGAKQVFLCSNGNTVMAFPLSKYSCGNLPKADFFTKVLKYEAIGRPDYQFHFYVPLVQWSASYLILFAITMSFFIISLAIILKVQRRFTNDILEPLENNLLDDEPINITQLDKLRKKIREISSNKEKEAAANAILEHKAKIAHNIRSLVQTLKSLQGSVQGKLSPTKKLLFNDVVEGIGDILTEFSTKTPPKSNASYSTEEAFYTNLRETNKNRSKIVISEVVKSVVNQKRFELKSKDSDTSLTCKCSSDLTYTFVDVDETELKSVLSNMINNSYEAIDLEKKQIKVNISLKDGMIKIRINDNGNGIPEHVRDSLFNRGVTFGKSGGSGYGLFHAKSYIESWGGNVSVESTSENGTTFSIEIPQWAPQHFTIDQGDTVVVLDDDPFIHDTWNSMLKRFAETSGKDFDVKYFSNPEEAQDWISDSEIDYSKTHFLVDNDLGDEYEKGSELIVNLGITNISTLVTNRYDDKNLGAFCSTHEIELLPKPCIFNSESLFS